MRKYTYLILLLTWCATVNGAENQAGLEDKYTPAINEEIRLLRQEINELKQPTACLVKLSADQAVTSGNAAKLALATETFDKDESFDPVSNYRYTVKYDGLYLVSLNCEFQVGAADDTLNAAIYKNGSLYITGKNLAGDSTTNVVVPVTVLLDLDRDDYLEFYALNNSTNDNIEADNTYASIILIQREDD